VGGPYHVFTAPADQSRARQFLSSDDWNLLDWSADGRFMCCAATDLTVLDLNTREGHKWQAVADVSSPGVSPDAR
jgi:hypothetical protein